MKVMVVGAGRMGSIRAEDLSVHPGVSEVVITNRNQERAHQLADKYGASVVDWDQALADPKADAVVVAVGTDAHQHVLSAVLPNGIPVLCEKPIALTLEDTEAALELGAKHGSQLQIGFQRRFDTQIRKLHEKIHSGQVGTLYSMTITSHDHVPSGKEFIAGSGGIFRDLHVHDFDLVRWLTGSEIASVYATRAVREHFDYAEFDDADVSAISLVTHNGVQVQITGARHNPVGHDVRLSVYGSKDSVTAGLNRRTPLRAMEQDLALNSDPYGGFVDRFREAFRNETNAFVSFAEGGIENPCPPESAVESLRVAVACEVSVATGQAVTVETP